MDTAVFREISPLLIYEDAMIFVAACPAVFDLFSGSLSANPKMDNVAMTSSSCGSMKTWRSGSRCWRVIASFGLYFARISRRLAYSENQRLSSPGAVAILTDVAQRGPRFLNCDRPA